MISMSVMSNNDNVPQSLYTTVKTRLFDKQDCKQYESEDCFIGNSIYTKIGDEKYDLNDNCNNCNDLQQPLLLSNESSVSLMDTKECHVVMPKLNKSLDVHLNKTKTINLKRLQVLVAKNIIRKDSVSLDMSPKKSVAQVVVGKNTQKDKDEKKLKHNQSLSECSDVLNSILEKVSLKNLTEATTNSFLEHEESNVERVVDEVSNDKNVICNGRLECESIQMSKQDSDLEAINQNSTDINYSGKIMHENDDICSNSSDYVSLKLSSDSDSDQEEEEIVNQCVEDSLLTITKQNFILDWLDTDRLPTPSPPPPTIVDAQYNGKKDVEFNNNSLEQNYMNDSISHELAVQLVPIDTNYKITKENVIEIRKNDTAVYVNSKTIETNDKHSEEILGDGISIVPEQIATDTANSEQKITPLKLYLKDIQKANSAKMLIKLIKKFNRLTVCDKDQVGQSIDNCERSGHIDKESPSVVLYATVDNNCVIENVEFTGKKAKTVDSVEKSNSCDKETDEETSKTKDDKQNYQKGEKLSLEVLESKVDEVSRNFKFDLEDSISFKKSAINLLSNEKVNSRKRKKYEPHQIHRKSNKKQLKDDVNVKSIHEDNESEDTDNGLKILSNCSDSNDEYKKETTDEEFCPSGSDFSDNKTSGKKCNTRKQRSKPSTICQESKDSSLEDKTANYKKMLRKRQIINFVDEIYSDDDFEDNDIPNPIESKRRKNKKEKADGKIVDVLLNTSTNSTSISSVASICETSAITAPAEDTSSAIDLVIAECPTITEEIETKDNNSSTNSEVMLDSPLDLSKKVQDNQIENTDIKENSNNKLFLLKPTIMENKKPEATQTKTKSIEDKLKNNSDQEKKKMDEEDLRQRISKCIENNYHTYLNQQEKNLPINPPYPMPASLLSTFPFAIYSAEHFKTEYQRLRTELATLDFVAEQKERERNNILQLKRHRLAAMHQLQLRKELLSKATKTQSLNNSSITTTTTTTTTAIQPLIISTASLHCTNERYQIPTSSPAAHLSTATEVTSSFRSNGVVVRPIVVKATPTNHPVMPLRPKCSSGYSPGILLANQNWPRSVIPIPNNGTRHNLSSVQTIISKATENIGIQWVNDNRSSPIMPTIQQQIAAQKPFENMDKLSANSQSITVINQQTKLRSDTLVTANMQLPEGYRTSTLAQLLSTNQNCNKLSTQRKLAPRWPTCQNCQNQMARYICAGCNKQWYCSEKCQIADWKSHFKTCKK